MYTKSEKLAEKFFETNQNEIFVTNSFWKKFGSIQSLVSFQWTPPPPPPF